MSRARHVGKRWSRKCQGERVIWECPGRGHFQSNSATGQLQQTGAKEDCHPNTNIWFFKRRQKSECLYEISLVIQNNLSVDAIHAMTHKFFIWCPATSTQSSPCLVSLCILRCPTLILAHSPPSLSPPSGPFHLLTWAAALIPNCCSHRQTWTLAVLCLIAKLLSSWGKKHFHSAVLGSLDSLIIKLTQDRLTGEKRI